LDYLQVEIKKNVNAQKESMVKQLNENEFIKNNENTVDDDLSNVESATDDAAMQGWQIDWSIDRNFIRTYKKTIFRVVNFVFIK